MSFKVSWKLHIFCFIFGFIICFMLQNSVVNIFINPFLDNKIFPFTGSVLIDMIIFIFLLFIPITFVHEMLHGFTYELFGGKVKYGFKVVYAYAQEISGIMMHRTKFLIILLAPVTVISVISLLIPDRIGSMIFLLNLLGSTGDLLMALYLCRSDADSYIIDRSYGFDIVKM